MRNWQEYRYVRMYNTGFVSDKQQPKFILQGSKGGSKWVRVGMKDFPRPVVTYENSTI